MAEPQEFDCAECGRHIFRFGAPAELPLCAHCIHLPGWFEDPELQRILDPDWRGAGSGSDPAQRGHAPRR